MPDAVANYMSTDPTGAANARFPGGIEIQASHATDPIGSKSVKWVRREDGVMVAETYTQDNATTPKLEYVTNIGDGLTSGLEWRVAQNAPGLINRLRLRQRPTSDNNLADSNFTVSLEGGTTVNILNGDGNSDFVWRAGIRVVYFAGPFTGTALSDKTVTINAPSTSLYHVLFQGSCYSGAGGGYIGLDLYLNGVRYANAYLYANEVGSHKAMNLSIGYFSFTSGPLLCQVRNAAPGSVPVASDGFDGATLMFIPCGGPPT